MYPFDTLGSLGISAPKLLDCYWVGSLDYFLRNQRFSIKPTKKKTEKQKQKTFCKKVVTQPSLEAIRKWLAGLNVVESYLCREAPVFFLSMTVTHVHQLLRLPGGGNSLVICPFPLQHGLEYGNHS